MKKFEFRYKTLLEIRERRVDDFKNSLRKLNHSLDELEYKKNALINAQLKYFDDMDKELKLGTSAQRLQFLNAQKKYFIESLQSVDNEIRELRLEIEGVKQSLAEAVKQKKIMEKLKEKALEDYIADVESKEVKSIEEIVNYNNYKGRGV